MTKFRRLRRERGLGQIELAALLGCSQPSVVNYDYGRNVPRNPQVRARMEALFGCSVRDLMEADERPVNANGDARKDAAAVTIATARKPKVHDGA